MKKVYEYSSYAVFLIFIISSFLFNIFESAYQYLLLSIILISIIIESILILLYERTKTKSNSVSLKFDSVNYLILAQGRKKSEEPKIGKPAWKFPSTRPEYDNYLKIKKHPGFLEPRPKVNRSESYIKAKFDKESQKEEPMNPQIFSSDYYISSAEKYRELVENNLTQIDEILSKKRK